MPQARGDGRTRACGIDVAMQKASDDANKKADTILQERLGIEDLNSELACRHGSSQYLYTVSITNSHAIIYLAISALVPWAHRRCRLACGTSKEEQQFDGAF